MARFAPSLVVLFATSMLGCAVSASGCDGCGERPPASQWTTVGERIGPWSFATLLETGPGLVSDEGEALGLRAEQCAQCHEGTYQQWRGSTHAAALADLQYLAEISKSSSPRWLCLNCHIPLARQRPYRVSASTRLAARGNDLRGLEKVPNPDFDPALQAEAITCATCHVTVGAEGRSVVRGPRGDSQAPHPIRAGRAELRRTCVRCHSPGPARLTPTFFCWFETADELANGPYGGDEDCVDCHMPRGPDGVPSHAFIGGGVPKSYAGYDHLAKSWAPGLDLGPVSLARGADGSITVTVPLTNARAGHDLPTADPERFILVVAEALDADARVVQRATLRIGQRWDFGDDATGRPARRLEDTRLGPKEVRRWTPTLPAELAKVRVSALHVRLTPANARHMMQTDVSEMVTFRRDVVEKVRSLPRHYPMFTWLAREELSPAGALLRRWSRAELLAESARGGHLEALEELLGAGPQH